MKTPSLSRRGPSSKSQVKEERMNLRIRRRHRVSRIRHVFRVRHAYRKPT